MDLGDRMKGYERVGSPTLMRKTPVIIRLDGKAFHSYTKNKAIDFPFSELLRETFSMTTNLVIQKVQGARLAYMQSDEVSILLTDWKNLNTDAWFKYGAQKMVSVISSMFTYHFNEISGIDSPAFFDARAFNVPLHEVTNYFIWRQQDASRNSVQMLGRSVFSHRQLHGKNNSQIQDMLMGVGINWNDVETKFKRGHCITSRYNDEDRLMFDVDWEPPVFTQNRLYIENHLV